MALLQEMEPHVCGTTTSLPRASWKNLSNRRRWVVKSELSNVIMTRETGVLCWKKQPSNKEKGFIKPVWFFFQCRYAREKLGKRTKNSLVAHMLY